MENLVELKQDELQEVEGGFLLELALIYAGIAVYEIMDRPEDVASGFLDAFN